MKINSIFVFTAYASPVVAAPSIVNSYAPAVAPLGYAAGPVGKFSYLFRVSMNLIDS